MQRYDYIIIGAGSAGCIMAYRLSEDSGKRVLLLEAGGEDNSPFIHMPKGIAKAMADPACIWPYETEAQPTTNDMRESWARGRTLGGSSSINGMVYVRGQDADFNALAEMTSDDWSWKHIGAAYKAFENHELGAAATRGDAGPLEITLPDTKTPLTEAVVAAGAALGLTRKDDVNDPEDIERVGYMPRTIAHGRRQSTAVAFLSRVRHRPNLTVITGVVVDQLLFDGDKVSGVRALRNNEESVFYADREVLLAAGALSSPAVLQRSGIGPEAHLKQCGIPVKVNLPQVGYNLREHRGIVMQWRIPDHLSQNREFRGVRLVKNVLQYYLTHTGAMTSAAYDLGLWFKSRPESPRPDGQIIVSPFTFDYSSPKFGVEKHGGINMCVYMLRPDSTGSVLVGSADPHQLPVITANYNSETSDRRKTIDCIRFARKLAKTQPLSQYILEETRPGAASQSDEEILEAHRLCGYGSYHASGSCRMGNDEQSVVDPELKVRGLRNLRVIDTSVFPFMLSGNTNGPAMAIAWRAADIVIRDNR